MLRRTTIGLLLSIFLLLSYVLVFEVRLPEANAALFSDDFANINSWTVVNGVWTSADSVLQGTSIAGGEGLIWAGNTSWTNYKVTANLRLINSADASLVLRYKDPSNFYWLSLGSWGHKYSISRVVGGIYQELASFGLVSEVEIGRWYLVSAVAVDSTLQLFVDGVKVLEVKDSSLSNGAIGFRDWTGTMQAEYLNVQSMTWSKTYGAGNANSIVRTFDGGYALASNNKLLKSDSNGNLQWTKTFLGTFSDVIQTLDSGYLMTGYTTNLTETSGNSHIYLVKTDSNGNMQWNKTYHPAFRDSGSSVIQTSDGGYAVLGIAGTTAVYSPNAVYFIKTDAYGNKQWDKNFGDADSVPYSVVQASDGGYAIVARSNYFRFGTPTYAYLIKISSSGNQLWQTSYGNCFFYSAVQASDNGYMLAGYTYTNATNGNDLYLVKTDSTGNQVWNRTYGGTGDDRGNSGILTVDGGYAITGYSNSSGFGGNDVYLVKTDSSGIKQWQETYGGTGADAGSCIVQTSDKGYAISGSLASDIFLVKVPPDESPLTVDNYNRFWQTSDFTITLKAADDEFTNVSSTSYKINDGSTLSVGSNGQPAISTEGTNNKLEYWSVDNLGHSELPHKILTGIKLDKTAPSGSIVINNGAASTTSTSVTLTLTYSDVGSGVSQVRYSNDGVWDTVPWESPSASKPWTLSSGDGTKTVYYQIKDNSGLTSTTSATIGLSTTTPTPPPTSNPQPQVDSTKPIANAGRDQIIKEGTSVTLDGSSSSDNVGIVSYTWTFKDVTDQNLNGKTTAHTFNFSGIYTIALSVKDAAGNGATDSMIITVLDAVDPQPEAGPNQEAYVGATVSFDAGNSNDNVGITSFDWSFGDGSNGTGKTTAHTYANPGNYVVKLTVKDQAGNVATDELAVAVSAVASPIPLWWVLVVVAIIVVATIVAFLLLKFFRKRPKLRLKAKAEPVTLIANGSAKSIITLQLVDQKGKPIAALADTPIRVTATKGKLESPVVTIPKGKDSEKTILVSSTETGPAPVTVNAEGLKSITITLNFTEKSRYCMHCGTMMQLNAKACQNCGKTPPAGTDTKACPNCESVIPSVAKFCSECGAGQPLKGEK